MEVSIRRGREADMPVLRDILNYYILKTVVTFEMVELSLENRKTWFTQFSETGRYQLFVAEEAGEVVGYAASLRFHQRPAYCTFGDEQYLSPSGTYRKGNRRKGIYRADGKYETGQGCAPSIWAGGPAQSRI